MKVSKLAVTGALLVALSLASGAVAQKSQPEQPAGLTAKELLDRSMANPLRDQVEQAIEKREYPEAEKLLIDEIHRQPKSPDLLKVLGGVFFLDGKYLNAAIAFRKAEGIVPLDPRSRFTLAMSYVILGHRDWARPELQKLKKDDPGNFLYPYWLSRLDYDSMRYKIAVSELQEAIKLNPHFANAYDNLGLCLEALGHYDEAVHAYRRAVELNHQPPVCSPWPALNLGALLIKMNRLDEADVALKDSLHCAPRFPNAHYQLGLLLEKRGMYPEAIEQLQNAVTLKPSFADPYYALGRAYRHLGESKKAQAALDTFQDLKKKETASAGK